MGRFLLGLMIVFVGFGAIYYGIQQSPGAPDVVVAGEPAAEEAPPETEAAPEPTAAPVADPAPVPPSGADPDNAGLRINAEGLAIIKESEGLRLEAYEANGRWYIGYGHNATARAGMKITEADAEALLRQDVSGSEESVRRLVTVPVNVNEFSAMVSLCYNLGAGNFSKSAVVREINAGNRQAAADAFRNHVRAGYQVLEHLEHRREKERTLFLSPA